MRKYLKPVAISTIFACFAFAGCGTTASSSGSTDDTASAADEANGTDTSAGSDAASTDDAVQGDTVAGTDATVQADTTQPDATGSTSNTWVVETSGTGAGLHSVIWANGRFVAVGGGDPVKPGDVALTSTDGVKWNLSVVQSTLGQSAIAANSTTYVVVGGTVTSSFITTSPDGSNWTTVNQTFKSPLNALVWSAERSEFMAVGNAGAIVRSADGTTWEERSSGVGQDLTGLAWTGSSYVAVGQAPAGPGQSAVILTSTDGTAWTVAKNPASLWFDSVASNGKVTVALGMSSQSSTDLATWTALKSAPNGEVFGLHWSGNRFIAGTQVSPYPPAGALATSTDGLTWTDSGLTKIKGLFSVASSPTCDVAVGESGTIVSNCH